MSTIAARPEGAMVPSPPVPISRVESPTPRTLAPLEDREGKLPELRTGSKSLDRKKPLPTTLQSDFIPEDILFALTQVPSTPESLGPLSKTRSLTTSIAPTRKTAANVWSYKRRDKFKHLTENTVCLCGAGKDISFLYDVPKSDAHPERQDTIDHSIIRKDGAEKPKQPLQLPDTLIPDEYHIVKNRGVMGLEFHEDKYTTNPEDHEKHLVVFPSMNPASRYEVIQLKKTMEEWLDRAGVNDADVEVKGPTQMHNLLELIKKEQNIYNVVFHELIRQSSVECSERGELLSDLRKKYSDLLNKVPQQIKSLHEEVMAQRALDRRLTEELMRFKTTISVLTNELSEVKEHDRRVTSAAQQAQEDLKAALSESQKNASLLAEYHDLYELQRKRLERQVFMLTDERELWSTAAYSLAMKVTEEAQLTTAKRLHVSEKAWAKLGNHFTILLSDKDTELLTKIQSHVEKWRDLVEEFNMILKQREVEMRSSLKSLRGGIERWMHDIRKTCLASGRSKEGRFMNPPDDDKLRSLFEDIKKWEEIAKSSLEIDEVLGKEAEKFGGDTLLSGQEQLYIVRTQMNGWTDNALRVFSRHRREEGKVHPDQNSMLKLNEDVEELLNQFNTRITGENGVATNVIHLMNGLESWNMKIASALNGTVTIHDSDWGSLYQLMEEWLNSIDEAVEYVGTSQREEERMDGRAHTSIDVLSTVRLVQKWITTATNGVDSEDGKLVEQVSTLHSEMVCWMVQVLLRLAPDKEENSKEASEMALLGSLPIHQLHANAKSLFDQLESFSRYVSLCCNGIVMESTQRRRDNMEENADHELKDLQRVRSECDDWIRTAKLLMSQLAGESVESLFPPKIGEPEVKERSGRETTDAEIVYVDQEKLEQPSDAEEQGQASKPAEKDEGQKTEETQSEEPQQEVPSTEKEGTSSPVQDKPTSPVQDKPTSLVQDKPKEEEKHVTIQEPAERIEVIGHDDNTHVRQLDHSPDQFPSSHSRMTTGQLEGPDTQRAFEALAAVDALQKQLFGTEERAQAAEERASNAEAELAETQERQRALEKRIGQLEMEASHDDAKSSKSIRTDKSESPAPSAKPSKEKESKEEKKRPESQQSRASSKASSKSKKK